MKLLLISTTLFFSLCSCGNSNVKPVESKTVTNIPVPEAGPGIKSVPVDPIGLDTVAVLKAIRTQYTAINSKLASYKKKDSKLSGLSAEGGALTSYYDHSDLVKEQVVLYGETGKVEMDNYYNKEGLIFQYKKETQYDKPIYEKGFKVKNTVENRFYFHKKNLVQWLGSGNKVIPSGTEAFKKQGEVVLEEIKNIGEQ